MVLHPCFTIPICQSDEKQKINIIKLLNYSINYPAKKAVKSSLWSFGKAHRRGKLI